VENKVCPAPVLTRALPILNKENIPLWLNVKVGLFVGNLFQCTWLGLTGMQVLAPQILSKRSWPKQVTSTNLSRTTWDLSDLGLKRPTCIVLGKTRVAVPATSNKYIFKDRKSIENVTFVLDKFGEIRKKTSTDV